MSFKMSSCLGGRKPSQDKWILALINIYVCESELSTQSYHGFVLAIAADCHTALSSKRYVFKGIH